jgi:hypothetical protein
MPPAAPWRRLGHGGESSALGHQADVPSALQRILAWARVFEILERIERPYD